MGLTSLITTPQFSQWSGNGLISSYTNLILGEVGVTSASQKTLINGVMQLMNLGMAILSALYVERVGRRKLFLISNVGMLLSEYSRFSLLMDRLSIAMFLFRAV